MYSGDDDEEDDGLDSRLKQRVEAKKLQYVTFILVSNI